MLNPQQELQLLGEVNRLRSRSKREEMELDAVLQRLNTLQKRFGDEALKCAQNVLSGPNECSTSFRQAVQQLLEMQTS